MPVLTIEEAQADLARVAEQHMRLAQEESRAADADMEHVLVLVGQAIRQADVLIERIPSADVEWAPLLAEARARRADLYAVIKMYAPEDAWFWSEGWQAGEREVDAQIAAGEGMYFDSDEAFFAHLDRLTGDNADP